MAAADVEEGLLLLMKRFDRIGFGRRGVLDAEEQVDAFRRSLDGAASVAAVELVRSWLHHAAAARVAGPLHYTRPEDVQALCVNLLARWNDAALGATLDALERAGEFRSEDGHVSEALRTALDEARHAPHR